VQNSSRVIYGFDRILSGPRISGKRSLITHTKLSVETTSRQIGMNKGTDLVQEKRTNRWGYAKSDRTRSGIASTTNQFTSVAPVWFYTLLQKFMEHREQSRLWGGEIGATLLANFIATLSNIVDCCSQYQQSSQVMAKDLIQLTWTFWKADVAEVRAAVLYSVGTSLDRLRDDVVIDVLFGNGPIFNNNNGNLLQSIQSMASNDPDDQCRTLSRYLSDKIVETVRTKLNNNPVVLSVLN
jgi:hypothetical protein